MVEKTHDGAILGRVNRPVFSKINWTGAVLGATGILGATGVINLDAVPALNEAIMTAAGAAVIIFRTFFTVK